MKKTKRIGILNSGGDVPGLNAVIAAAVKTANTYGYECLGFVKGFEGLLNPVNYYELTPQKVWEITGKGGTILKSVNKGRFPAVVGEGKANIINRAILSQAKSNIEKLGLEALIVIGGDGTLSAAQQLVDIGVQIVGVPKTIDNDLSETDKTFGFMTAVSSVVDSIDKLRTTASSHDRIFFVETMGRNAGWIALYSGVAAEADIILLPEFKFDYEAITNKLIENVMEGKNYQIVVVAEGAEANGQKSYKAVSSDRANLLGGVSGIIMENIKAKLGPDNDIDMRNIVLGHTQRGGAPNADDRILAQRFGQEAIHAIMKKKFNKMVALKGDKIELVDIKEAIQSIKSVKQDNLLVKTAMDMGIGFGI